MKTKTKKAVDKPAAKTAAKTKAAAKATATAKTAAKAAVKTDSPAKTENTDHLAPDNLPLSDGIAARLRRLYCWVPIEDLKSYAYLGLALAAKAYEPSRGVPFPQFAWRKGMYLAIDEMRKDGVLSRRRTTPAPTFGTLTPDIPDPYGPKGHAAVDRKDMCTSLLKKLRPQDRQLLMMYYSDELTFKEIAKVFDISESAVCLRHKALIERLRRLGRPAMAA
ncbi:MAG: sigma-70 family RNA polymerase sigma factor [Planctomycetota bacterium]